MWRPKGWEDIRGCAMKDLRHRGLQIDLPVIEAGIDAFLMALHEEAGGRQIWLSKTDGGIQIHIPKGLFQARRRAKQW